MVEHIRQQATDGGCACLRCQRVDSAVLRRSILGDLLWAITLLRRYPSLVALTVVLTLVSGLLWPVLEVGPQTWPIGTALAFYIALHGTVLRAYTVAVTTDALTGDRQSRWRLFVDSLRRLPAVVATLVATVAAALVALFVATVVVFGFVTVVDSVDRVVGFSIAARSVFEGASATVVFGSATALGMVKLWLAPEICVARGCGPLAAVRTSWILTRLHWWRVVVVISGFAFTVFGPEFGGHVIAYIGGEWLLWEPLVGLAHGLYYGLAYAVWFSVGTQIYVRHVFQS